MRRLAVLVTSVGLLWAASSADAGAGRLELMPLPRAALGSDTGALVLAPGSGVVSNTSAARDAAPGFTAANLADRGRITGYTLDYVLPNATVPQKRHRLLGVQTIAERYRDAAAAVGGLSFWRGVTRRRSGAYAAGVTVGVSAFAARVGNGCFAFELSYRRVGQALYYVGDIVFRSGPLLGAVFVSATDATGLRARTLDLADQLAIRIRRVLAGQIH
ncbi:MAG: hypothetical protein ACRDLP_01440 [Solirubrobacteraceae bacterium]